MTKRVKTGTETETETYTNEHKQVQKPSKGHMHQSSILEDVIDFHPSIILGGEAELERLSLAAYSQPTRNKELSQSSVALLMCASGRQQTLDTWT